MDPIHLIPTADAIPAPSWIFLVLEIFTTILHFLLMNIVLGGSLLLLFSQFGKNKADFGNSLPGPVISKLPTSFALAVNLGIAPLLFLQVLYGHFFYTSSVLMAVYWILVIPFLIIAYYSAYIHYKKFSTMLSKIAILITSVMVTYIAFIFVNNMTLMAQPEKWNAYFASRSGTILNWGDTTLLPRYLHFLTAAIAVAGLFISLIWWMRSKKNTPDAENKVKSGLKIFGIATALQIVIGFWFLLAMPTDFILQFMGQNLFYTIILFAGVLLGIGAMILAFMNKFVPTVIHLLATIVLMVITRVNLRSLYLNDVYQINSLKLSPQYDVLILFLLIFIIGLVVVGYMLKISFSVKKGGAIS